MLWLLNVTDCRYWGSYEQSQVSLPIFDFDHYMKIDNHTYSYMQYTCNITLMLETYCAHTYVNMQIYF